MVEEAEVVVLVFEGSDHPLDEIVEFEQVVGELLGNVEVHGVSLGMVSLQKNRTGSGAGRGYFRTCIARPVSRPASSAWAKGRSAARRISCLVSRTASWLKPASCSARALAVASNCSPGTTRLIMPNASA